MLRKRRIIQPNHWPMAHDKHYNKCPRNAFTLLEVLIVFVVIGLIMAIAAPKLMDKSERMAEESALSAIRNAVNETAMKARMTGQALTLVLDIENNSMQTGNVEDANLERKWQPPNHSNDTEERPPAFLVQTNSSYNLPADIVWTAEEEDLNEDGNVVFTFFPDGQAAARELQFTIGNKNFLLRIDRITADPLILVFND